MKLILKIILISTMIQFVACEQFDLVSNTNSDNTTSYFVNPTYGSDNNSGSKASPFKSIWKASRVTDNGDTIFLREGTHTAFKDSIQRTDSQTDWIYIMPYNNEIVVLDGTGYNFIFDWQPIFQIQSSSFISVQNLDIRHNNLGGGLVVYSNSKLSENIIIKNCKILDVSNEGIKIQGSNVLVEGCEIDSAVMKNRNFISTGNHSAALVSFWHTSQAYDICRNITFRNNIVHDSWGEGIAFARTDGFVCEGNKVYDCPYCFIYCDNAYNGVIKNNFLNGINPLYYENVSGLSVPANGIFWAAEGNFYMLDRIVENINIHNNLILNARAAFGWFDDDLNNNASDSYRNINIYYNTVYHDIGFETFYIEPNVNPLRTPPSNCNFKNNIIDKAVYEYFALGSDLFNHNIWAINNNCFAEGNIPQGFETNNISGDPSFINANGYIPDNYKLQSNSICKGSGIYINNFTVDFWNNLRNNPPCMGFHEVY